MESTVIRCNFAHPPTENYQIKSRGVNNFQTVNLNISLWCNCYHLSGHALLISFTTWEQGEIWQGISLLLCLVLYLAANHFWRDHFAPLFEEMEVCEGSCAAGWLEKLKAQMYGPCPATATHPLRDLEQIPFSSLKLSFPFFKMAAASPMQPPGILCLGVGWLNIYDPVWASLRKSAMGVWCTYPWVLRRPLPLMHGHDDCS